ncbi:MAG: hypothetical protein CMJ32_09145 [Phycisphaerae bacterium]|nr:hypothetical protein [Phycisphaerae bacterium]
MPPATGVQSTHVTASTTIQGTVDTGWELARCEGLVQLNATGAILKGALESEVPVHAVFAPRRLPFDGFSRVQGREHVQRQLAMHQMRILSIPGPVRCVRLLQRAISVGHNAITLIPNDQLGTIASTLERLVGMASEGFGCGCIILEDNPALAPSACPRLAARRFDVPAIEVASLDELRDAIEQALRFAMVDGSIAMIIAHSMVLRSVQTIQARANRVVDSVDQAAWLHRARLSPRTTAEQIDSLRLARRLELDRTRSLPSPGEIEPVGFILCGPARVTARHVLQRLGLSGRIPLLELRLLNPIDDSIVARFLQRCRDIVILEPRTSSMVSALLAVSEVERRRDPSSNPARLWWQELPPTDAGDQLRLEPSDALNPSILARKLSGLFLKADPSLKVDEHLVRGALDEKSMPIPVRGEGLGQSAAIHRIQDELVSLDAWIREQTFETPTGSTHALFIEGKPVPTGVERIVYTETWDRRRFLAEGAGVFTQVMEDSSPRIVVVCDLGGTDADELVRFCRGVTPPGIADWIGILQVELADGAELSRALRDAATKDMMTVIIARETNPRRLDTTALERSTREIDRLGFSKLQRVIWSADNACELRLPSIVTQADLGLESSPGPLQTVYSSDRISDRVPTMVRFRIRPQLEQVEVLRTQPPEPPMQLNLSRKLPVPRPVHSSSGIWRVHLAGYRGESPGLAAMAMLQAGRFMDYQVMGVHRAIPIGPGRRAWSQVLFTRPRDGEPLPMRPEIPWGEADLLLGMDPIESVRAIGPDPELRVASSDRTSAVINTGLLEDQQELGQELPEILEGPLDQLFAVDGMLVADLAAACRRCFLTDRMLDLVLLGAAFQRGFVPLTTESIEAALASMEQQGFGRCQDAFALGRHFSVEPEMSEPSRIRHDEPTPRLKRRLVLTESLSRRRGSVRSRQMNQLLDSVLSTLEPMAKSSRGRASINDMLICLQRCVVWGGIDLARRYADLVTRIFEVDDQAEAYPLVRGSILPLADALLIRDIYYVSSMQVSLEQTRRTRQRLSVRPGRGDTMDRRFLTRVDLVIGSRRWRLDIRSSDWLPRLAARLSRVIPKSWRGTPAQRQRRTWCIDFFESVISDARSDRDSALARVQRLHELASRTRLRGVSVGELEHLVARAGDEDQSSVDAS